MLVHDLVCSDGWFKGWEGGWEGGRVGGWVYLECRLDDVIMNGDSAITACPSSATAP